MLLDDKTCVFGFYIIMSVNIGTRYGDTTRIRHSDMEGLAAGDYLSIREQKTGKVREIQLNEKVVDAYTYLRQRLIAINRLRSTGYIFTSNKGTIFRVMSMNRLLKEHFAGYTKQISTHSLRKSFGRRVYENSGRSEDSLIKLSELFQHASMATTRRYLGLRREELDNLYMTL
jgi:site-specific recombinase XerD